MQYITGSIALSIIMSIFAALLSFTILNFVRKKN
jgi:hypothetical protein